MIAEMVAISSGETMSFHTARGWLNDWVANKAGPNQERIEWQCEWSAKPKPRVIAEYRLAPAGCLSRKPSIQSFWITLFNVLQLYLTQWHTHRRRWEPAAKACSSRRVPLLPRFSLFIIFELFRGSATPRFSLFIIFELFCGSAIAAVLVI